MSGSEEALQPGEAVEVRSVWAGGRNPISDWFGGYAFVAIEPRQKRVSSAGPEEKVVVVRNTSRGTFEGCESLWPVGDVRRAQKKEVKRG